MTADLSIAALLQAAEYLEKREAEHGYASSMPITLATSDLMSPYKGKQPIASKYNDQFNSNHHDYTQGSSPKSNHHNINSHHRHMNAINNKSRHRSDNINIAASNQDIAKRGSQLINTDSKSRSTRGSAGNGHNLSSRVSVSSLSSCSNQSGIDFHQASGSSSGGSCPTTNGYLDFSSISSASSSEYNELNHQRCNNNNVSSSAIGLAPLGQQVSTNHRLLVATSNPEYHHHLLLQQRSPPTSLSHHHLIGDLDGDISMHCGDANSLNGSCSSKRPKKKSQGNRSTHNELEKNRRAHLRTCLEKLKEVVPLESDSSRHTTLGLLTKAKGFIRTLEDCDRRQQMHIAELMDRQRFLRSKLEEINKDPGSQLIHNQQIQVRQQQAQNGLTIVSENYSPTSLASSISATSDLHQSVMSSSNLTSSLGSTSSGPSNTSPAPSFASINGESEQSGAAMTMLSITKREAGPIMVVSKHSYERKKQQEDVEMIVDNPPIPVKETNATDFE